MAELDDLVRARPMSLTYERAMALLPTLRINPEWQRKKDAGELEDGILGMCGMLDTVWPAEQFTQEEAEWIRKMSDQGSMRWLADMVVMDDNQIYGMHLIEAADRILGPAPTYASGRSTEET